MSASPGHRLAIIGDGQMGHAIEALARERGWEVVASIGVDANRDGKGITRDSLRGAEVAVEFTEPSAAAANVSACLRAGCPVVVGTTGWHDSLPALTGVALETGTSLLWATNFSTGVNIFIEIARRAGALMSHNPGFNAAILETHHTRKKDAPSGTAITLQRAVAESLGRSVPITSVRVGSVPGTHTLTFDGEFEQITITHEARDRRIFADGALKAAEWLIGRPGGAAYTMSDVLGLGGAGE